MIIYDYIYIYINILYSYTMLYIMRDMCAFCSDSGGGSPATRPSLYIVIWKWQRLGRHAVNPSSAVYSLCFLGVFIHFHINFQFLSVVFVSFRTLPCS